MITKRLVLFTISLVLITMAAFADPHPHEPDGQTSDPDINTATAEIGDVIGQGGDATGGSGGSANNSIDIEDERQAPGIALGTASDSFGVGITTPVGGFLLNLPWSFGDRKVLAICDRIVTTPDWGACMCRTSVLKKLYDDRDACAQSLGGGSGDVEKTDAAQGLNRGSNLLAQVDPEMMKYHEELKAELEAQKLITVAQQAEIDALKTQPRQVDSQAQQQIQRQIQQQQRQIDYDDVRRANAIKELEKFAPRKSDG